jgi:hypothetical protein
VFSLEAPAQEQRTETKPAPVESRPAPTADARSAAVAKTESPPVAKKEPPASKESTTAKPAARSEKSEQAPAPVAEAVRHEKFSSQGVITLMGNGVVIFDREKRVQRMIGIGGTLPDGSVVRGIDLREGKVRTDKGDVVYD